ncbi:hypothetical protein MD484_g5140, partial [Candolleomyces efflorescens]
MNGAGAGMKNLSSASTGSTTTQATTNLSWGSLDLTSSRLDQFPAPPPTFTNPFNSRPTTPQQHIRVHSGPQQHQPLVEDDEDEDEYHESRFQNPLQSASSPPPLTSKWSESGHITPPLGKSGSAAPPRWAPPKAKWKLPFSNPFKTKPMRVQAVPPRAGFRLDDYDRNTESMLSGVVSKRSTISEGDEDSVFGGRTDSAIMNEASGGLDNFFGPSQNSRGGGAGDDEERATLISGEERTQNRVFLISKDGREDFSISGETSESGTNLSSTMSIGVVSPTASTVSSSKPLSAGGIQRDGTRVNPDGGHSPSAKTSPTYISPNCD